MARRVDDHSAWVGNSNKESILPMGVKTKSFSNGEGAGEVMDYEDTIEKISAVQATGVKKIKGHGNKPGYR
jgi:hypothetical protein